MANEITVLSEVDRKTDSGGTSTKIGLLFLYPISTPTQRGGANVVPTPSSGLPEVAQLVLTQGEKDALDAGTVAFEVVSYTVRPQDQGLTAQQHLDRARTIYASRQAEWQAAYDADAASRVGQRFDSV